jgi:hypothetical protein
MSLHGWTLALSTSPGRPLQLGAHRSCCSGSINLSRNITQTDLCATSTVKRLTIEQAEVTGWVLRRHYNGRNSSDTLGNHRRATLKVKTPKSDPTITTTDASEHRFARPNESN